MSNLQKRRRPTLGSAGFRIQKCVSSILAEVKPYMLWEWIVIDNLEVWWTIQKHLSSFKMAHRAIPRVFTKSRVSKLSAVDIWTR